MKTTNSVSAETTKTRAINAPAQSLSRCPQQDPATTARSAKPAYQAIIALALSEPTLTARITQIVATTPLSAPSPLNAARLSLRDLSQASTIPYRLLRHATRLLRLPILSCRSTTGDREPHLTLTTADAQTLLAFALGRHHKADLRHPNVPSNQPATVSQSAPTVAPACPLQGRDAAPPASQTSWCGKAAGGAEPMPEMHAPVLATEGAPAVAPASSNPCVEAALPARTDAIHPTSSAAEVPPQTSRCGKAAGGAEPTAAAPKIPQRPTAHLSRKGPRGPRAKQTPRPLPIGFLPSSNTSDIRNPISDFVSTSDFRHPTSDFGPASHVSPLAPSRLGGSTPPPPAPRTTAILRAVAADPALTAKIDSILARAESLGVATRHAAQRPDNPVPRRSEAEAGQPSLPPGRYTLNALGEAAQIRRSSLHHAVKQLRIITQLERRATGRGRRYATISLEEARTVLAFVFGPRPSIRSAKQPDGPQPYARHGLGRLYICLLEPDSDSGRFKIGWTGSLGQRLSKFLTSTPFGEYLHHWPCLRSWELTARAYITQGCEHIREEVYRTRNLPSLLARAAHFFTEMPDPTKSPS